MTVSDTPDRTDDAAVDQSKDWSDGSMLIAVDLDGSLLLTDTLYESFAGLLRTNPLKLLFLPFWLLRGKAYLKHRMAELAAIDVDVLPVNDALLGWLQKRKHEGHEIVLATAADSVIANKVAARFNIFSEVLASNGKANLSGEKKAQAIRGHFNGREFAYVGNSGLDRGVWAQARHAVAVNASILLQKRLRSEHASVEIVSTAKRSWRPYFKAMRPHQWAKNILIFLPVLASHRIHMLQLVDALTAFMAFSLCASSVYLVNDLVDLGDDRRHPSKQNRPLAKGLLPIAHGLTMAPILLLLAFVLAAQVSLSFVGVMAGYFLVTSGYSFFIKRKVLVDIVVLSMLYTIRVIAGAVATDVSLSFWLLAFSVFLFFSLAIVKRCRELQQLEAAGRLGTQGRGYHVDDLPVLRALGVGSGLMSVLVLALYINNPHVVELYRRSYWLWGVCLLHLSWVSWVWILTQRNEIDDDPVVFSVTDPVSLALGIGVAILIALSL